MWRRLARALSVLLVLGLSACKALPPAQVAAERAASVDLSELLSLPGPDALLIGEQHDAPDHPAIHQQVVERLISAGRLAALVLEMSERGSTSRGLANDAAETEVRQRLDWNEKAWSWSRYGPAIMAAVRTGIEVAGGNLPRKAMAEAMQDAALDRRLVPAVLQQLRQAIRDGHCGLLPESQIAPMTRIQIARDLSMAETMQGLARPGKQVLLLAGAAHVERVAGVPAHWRNNFRSISLRLLPAGEAASGSGGVFDRVWSTAAMPPQDHCAGLKRQLTPRTGTRGGLWHVGREHYTAPMIRPAPELA